jgi:hypothetical protein
MENRIGIDEFLALGALRLARLGVLARWPAAVASLARDAPEVARHAAALRGTG